jgi:hypothetical protein
MNRNVTIVTGLFDLKRGEIEGWGKRDFQQYKDRFFELLQADAQMCIWIPKELEEEVLQVRGDKPTQIYIKELEDFKTWFPFFDKVQEIRTNPEWVNFAGWLPESPQASLEYYNPMMMCKMFMVNDSAVMNPFNSEYFYWIDGGLTSTVNSGYFTHDDVLDNLENYTDNISKFTFIQYPYDGNEEIHGFERIKMAEYCGVDFVDKISRGGFWGGTKEQIHKINELYYSILHNTLTEGYMGADECLFTILTYQNPELIQPFDIEGNGLVWPFFENLKEYKDKPVEVVPFSKVNTILYVLTYNSPKQFEKLCQSFEIVDNNFLVKPRKVLLNNSIDRSTDEEYDRLCELYGFEQVHKDNIGICGGRQWCAEHFNETDADYYIFFEDDMFLHPDNNSVCRMGFQRYIGNLYNKTLKIIHNEKYDYLKLSFSEFYGENSVQWAWYNIPQDIREKYFPNNKHLPHHGTDPNAPKTQYNHIKQQDDLTYVEGNTHYCNWPLWMSKEGSKKIFLDVKWDHPFEQTWMSYVFQKQQDKEIKAAILLLSPINHDRFDFYPGEDRREN